MDSPQEAAKQETKSSQYPEAAEQVQQTGQLLDHCLNWGDVAQPFA